MVFGKIDYINLLPFHIFMKRFLNTQQFMMMQHKRGVPSKINRDFAARRVDAAFISSVTAHKRRFVSLGIVAKKEVRSVLIKPHTNTAHDQASATSNILSAVLQLQGKVLIGDEALRYALSGAPMVDLALEWHRRHGLPFVFALLCYHDHKHYMKRIEKAFLRHKVRIPFYILHHYSKQTGIASSDILDYLTCISYEIDHKALLGVKKFWKLSRPYR